MEVHAGAGGGADGFCADPGRGRGMGAGHPWGTTPAGEAGGEGGFWAAQARGGGRARGDQGGPRRVGRGAGHDAMILARKLPAAMVFVRSPEGLSHHPNESVMEADVATAYEGGLEFLGSLRDDRAMLETLVTHAREYRREVQGA